MPQFCSSWRLLLALERAIPRAEASKRTRWRASIWGKKKEGVDLGDGAIDPPARPHFAPMENELLGNGRERVPIHLLFLSKQKLEKTSWQSSKFDPAELAISGRVAHESRVLLSGSRRNGLYQRKSPRIAAGIKTKVRDCGAQSPYTREARATQSNRDRARRVET